MSESDYAASGLRLAYADPPYPGKSHLYPEKMEVDHAELIARLCEYDGWALSTDEINLSYVLSLCPPKTRVLAWCRSNSFSHGLNPGYSWEPVLCRPARTSNVFVQRSYCVTASVNGRASALTGSKTASFCAWVIECLGAEPGDSLDDIFPGTGVMGATWDSWRTQTRLPVIVPMKQLSHANRTNLVRRTHDPIPGMEPARPFKERRVV